jgi:hypothetical protein
MKTRYRRLRFFEGRRYEAGRNVLPVRESVRRCGKRDWQWTLEGAQMVSCPIHAETC